MSINGFNPLRHDCITGGCFNKVHRPHIEEFADCFYGTNNFGDCDGMVEKKGRLCLLEWKGTGAPMSVGQVIAFEHLTMTPNSEANGNMVFVVEGDPVTMKVDRYCVFYGGRQGEWKYASFADVKARIKQWDDYTSKLFFPRTPGGLENVGKP
jgi:hypothetical protein